LTNWAMCMTMLWPDLVWWVVPERALRGFPWPPNYSATLIKTWNCYWGSGRRYIPTVHSLSGTGHFCAQQKGLGTASPANQRQYYDQCNKLCVCRPSYCVCMIVQSVEMRPHMCSRKSQAKHPKLG
jgi:hypothetical protein